jgi:hypothetical protein
VKTPHGNAGLAHLLSGDRTASGEDRNNRQRGMPPGTAVSHRHRLLDLQSINTRAHFSPKVSQIVTPRKDLTRTLLVLHVLATCVIEVSSMNVSPAETLNLPGSDLAADETARERCGIAGNDRLTAGSC